jgi:hypothetical protein
MRRSRNVEIELQAVVNSLEKRLEKGVRKAAYMPELLWMLEPLAARLSVLRRLADLGVSRLRGFSNSFYRAMHPYPQRVWQVLGIVRASSFTDVYDDGERYYVKLMWASPLYAVVDAARPILFSFAPEKTFKIRGVNVSVYPIDTLEEYLEYVRVNVVKHGLSRSLLGEVEYLKEFEKLYVSDKPVKTRGYTEIYSTVLDALGFRHVYVPHDPLLEKPVEFLSPGQLEAILRRRDMWIAQLGRLAAVEQINNIRPLPLMAPADILAAARLLSAKGIEYEYAGVGMVNRCGLSLKLDTKIPLKRHFLILFPRRGLHRKVKPAKIVLEGSRLVLVDEEAINSLKASSG